MRLFHTPVCSPKGLRYIIRRFCSATRHQWPPPASRIKTLRCISPYFSKAGSLPGRTRGLTTVNEMTPKKINGPRTTNHSQQTLVLIKFAHPPPADSAFYHGICNVVDVFNFEFSGDQLIHHEFTAHGQVHELRDIEMGGNTPVKPPEDR